MAGRKAGKDVVGARTRKKIFRSKVDKDFIMDGNGRGIKDNSRF